MSWSCIPKWFTTYPRAWSPTKTLAASHFVLWGKFIVKKVIIRKLLSEHRARLRSQLDSLSGGHDI